MTNITAKIRTRELGTKLINVLACGLFFSHMIGFSLAAWFSLHGFGSFCRYLKALYFWSLGISLYLELFCFLSFITFVLRNLCSGTHRRNHGFPGLTVTLANHGVCSNPGTQVGNQSKDFRAVLQTDLSDA